jgi:hypothetical protein
MTTKPSSYGASGIYRVAEPSLQDGEGSALAISQRGNALIENYPQQVKIVESGGYTYVCFATVGTSVAASAWRIFRVDSTGNVLYADADDSYDNIATDPTLLNYSYS